MLAFELRSLGAARVRPLVSGVAFFGDLRCGLLACLWSATASRVLLVLARGDSGDQASLYQLIHQIPWEDHLTSSSSFCIDTHGTNLGLRDSRFVALRAKDAICDRMRERTGNRPGISREAPDVRVSIALRGNRASVGIDLSGSPLHQRGYRAPSSAVVAPLRETLAAAMLLLAGWGKIGDASGIAGGSKGAGGSESAGGSDAPLLLDPLCGSGTIAIEAALLAADRAPGLLRDTWGHSRWLGSEPDTWAELLDDADERACLGDERMAELAARIGRPIILASDINGAVVDVLKTSARKAGVANMIRGAICDIAELPHLLRFTHAPSRTLIVTNPPYGERMFSGAQLPAFYAALKNVTAASDLCLISSDTSISAYLGRNPARNIETYNGAIAANIAYYASNSELDTATASDKTSKKPNKAPGDVQAEVLGKDPSEVLGGSKRDVKEAVLGEGEGEGEGEGLGEALGEALGEVTQMPETQLSEQQFYHRLVKMAKHRGKWARRANIGCYRVYDADLPDYNVAIDLYLGADGTKDAGKRWLVVAEYKPSNEIAPDLAASRLQTVLAIAPKVLAVPTNCVYCKQRRRDKGGSQYASLGTARSGDANQTKSHLVSEGGLIFEVDFVSHLDTGLFFDHRQTRLLLKEWASAKDCLNLFAYTGVASVFMADGKAKTVTSVDMSRNYLDIAKRNHSNNGFKTDAYNFIVADALRWVGDNRHQKQKYGLIFCDPPTFSNSSKMGSRSWDVQRDHAELIIALTRMLTADGRLVFSTNLSSFKLDSDKLIKARVGLKEITAGTIPPDFARQKGENPAHRCYLIWKI